MTTENKTTLGIKTAVACAYSMLGLLLVSPTVAESQAAAFQQGALFGQVIDAASGKPVSGATVALRDSHLNVVTWTTTDVQGRYALAAPALRLLALPSTRKPGVMSAISRGFVQVVRLPVTAVNAAAGTTVALVKAVDPVGMVKAAAVGMLAGNPLPLAAEAAGSLQSVTGQSGQQQARTSAAQAVVDGVPAHPAPPQPAAPGQVTLLVSAPQYKEFGGPDGAYWLEKPLPASAPEPIGTAAWLDTVQLAPNASNAESNTKDQAVLLTAPTLSTVMPEAGSTVQISVRLQIPPQPAVYVRVVAREQKTGHAVELLPQADGSYTGTIDLPQNTPAGETTLSIAALNVEAAQTSSGDPKDLMALAEHLDSLNSDKPYRFDPQIMASENRLDLKITVLDPTRQTAAAPGVIAAAFGPPAPATPEKPDTAAPPSH